MAEHIVSWLRVGNVWGLSCCVAPRTVRSSVMAIYKPGSTPPAAQVVDNILYQQKLEKTATLQLSNQNRSKARNTGFHTGSANRARGRVGNAAFQNLDATIVFLDGQYDVLPDKAPWIEYAEGISGEWDLCASCPAEDSAKKLYRQYNYNRLLMGTGIINSPVVPDETADFFLNTIQHIVSTDTVLVGHADTTGDWFTVTNLDGSMNNPNVQFGTADYVGVQYPGSPLYNLWSQVWSGDKFVKLCIATQNGAPGLSFYTLFTQVA